MNGGSVITNSEMKFKIGRVFPSNMKEFNGNPAELAKNIVNPERIAVLAPGEAYELTRTK